VQLGVGASRREKIKAHGRNVGDHRSVFIYRTPDLKVSKVAINDRVGQLLTASRKSI
jgi:hypothetical protein